jgi:ribosome-associated protein
LLSALQLSDIAVKGLQEIKAQDIVRLDLRKSNGAVSNYFIIATGTSDKHVQSLADSVQRFIKEATRERPLSVEGMRQGEWVLLDYVNVVVHIFREEKRDFYRLESLWGDARSERL